MADENDAAEAVDDGTLAPIEGDEAEQEAPELNEVEQIASEMGWTPKDAWKGDEKAWKPASDFLKATKDVNRSMARDLKDMKRQIEGITRTSAAMTERAVAEAREKWEAQLDQAVDDGDKDAARKARAELSKLDRVDTKPAETPEGAEFAERHSSWFGKDEEATTYAVQRAGHYAEQGLSPIRQLKAVEKDMRELFPDLFEEEAPPERQKAPPTLGTPQRTVRTNAREKGYATLPHEARKACDAWVRDNGHRGAFATKESWAASYYQSQEAANG